MFICRNDIETSFNLEIRIISTTMRGPWFAFNKVVDSDTTNFKDLVDEIVDQFPCGYGDVVKLFYFCAASKSNIEIHSDHDLMNMFKKHMSSKYCCMSIAYHKPDVDPPKIPLWDNYYSIQMFRAAYEGKIPSLPDKSMWPKSEHGFFMHPPLLKSTAGRRRQNRYKAAVEGGSKGAKGRHQCPICQQYGHHWYTCKDGDPNDIAAMLAERYQAS